MKATQVNWNQRYDSCVEFVDCLRDAQKRVTPESVEDLMLETSDLAPFLENPSKTPERSFWSKKLFAAGLSTGLAAVIGCGLWIGFWSGTHPVPSPSITDGSKSTDGSEISDDPATVQSLNDIAAIFAKNESEAVSLMKNVIASNPQKAIPSPIELPGVDPIQRVLFLDDKLMVTLGYEPSPRVYHVPDLASFRDDRNAWDSTLLNRSGSLLYPQALSCQADSKAVLVGGTSPANLWYLKDSVLSTDRLAPSLKLPSGDLPGGGSEILATLWRDASMAAASDDLGNILLWQFSDQQVASSGHFATAWIADEMASSPGGEWLLVMTEDGDVQAARWSDVAKSIQVDRSPKFVSVKSAGTQARRMVPITFESEVMVVVGDQEGTLTTWNVETPGQWRFRTQSLSGSVESLCHGESRSKPIVVASDSDGNVQAWSPWDSPSNSAAKISKTKSFGSQPISSTAVSADGRWIVVGLFGEIALWDWSSEPEKMRRFSAGDSSVVSVAIDPSKRYVVAGCEDGTTWVWDFVHMKLMTLASPQSVDLPASSVL